MSKEINIVRNLNVRRAFIGLALILVLLVLPLAVFADNVQNDVVVGGNDTITVGGSTTIGYRITANNGDGQNGCNASDGSAASVTINTPPGVTATPNSLSFTACSVVLNTVFTASAAGNYPITVSVSDPGAGTYNTNPAAFTLHVLAPSDSTPPVITPNVSGTLGNNGWYISDVTVSWTVSDPESAVSSTNGCSATTIDNDTTGTTLTCYATSTGGTTSQSVTIMRDATAPTISGTASPSPNSYGWNNTDVTVSFTCSDSTSGIFSCSSNQIVSNEGANQSVGGTAEDNAGNTNTTTVSPINIDKTAPVVSLTGFNPNEQFVLGSVLDIDCDTQDSLSGVATAAAVSITGGSPSGVGMFTATCDGAGDKAGNSTGPVSANYYVVYNWAGFFQPVDNNALNVTKAGSAIPVKFSLNGYFGMDIFAPGYPKSVAISCNTGQAADEIEQTLTAGQSSLNYDSTTNQYNYVWKTDKAWSSTCRKLEIKLIDGTMHSATFQFKK